MLLCNAGMTARLTEGEKALVRTSFGEAIQCHRMLSVAKIEEQQKKDSSVQGIVSKAIFQFLKAEVVKDRNRSANKIK